MPTTISRAQVKTPRRTESKKPAAEKKVATRKDTKPSSWRPKNNDEAIRRWRERNTGPIVGSRLGPGFGGPRS